jgi:hypothetical protein
MSISVLTHAIQVEVVEKPSEEVVELCEKFFGPGLGSEQERNPAFSDWFAHADGTPRPSPLPSCTIALSAWVPKHISAAFAGTVDDHATSYGNGFTSTDTSRRWGHRSNLKWLFSFWDVATRQAKQQQEQQTLQLQQQQEEKGFH